MPKMSGKAFADLLKKRRNPLLKIAGFFLTELTWREAVRQPRLRVVRAFDIGNRLSNPAYRPSHPLHASHYLSF
jgi:hypothetical protein